jgi:hypothetical protein
MDCLGMSQELLAVIGKFERGMGLELLELGMFLGPREPEDQRVSAL